MKTSVLESVFNKEATLKKTTLKSLKRQLY